MRKSALFGRLLYSQEGVKYYGYISWHKRNRFSRSRKSTAPVGMVEVKVRDFQPITSAAGNANVRIEFRNSLVLDPMI